MANSPLTRLTSVAVDAFRFLETQKDGQYPFRMEDGVYDAIQRSSFLALQLGGRLKAAVPFVFPEPDFSAILAREDERTPMLMTGNGGSRITPEVVLAGMFASARIQMLLFNVPNSEAGFVRTVVQNYEELRKAVAGDRVTAYCASGISGISLSEGRTASTPWGVLLPAPKVRPSYAPFMVERPRTTCTLIEKKKVSVKFDLAAQPKWEYEASDERRNPKASFLFALSCVLSLEFGGEFGGPVETWSTNFLPFFGVHSGAWPTRAGRGRRDKNVDGSVRELESWSEKVEANHSEDTEIAASRLVSAVVHREQEIDSLIDAVMVWENLLGTSSEVSFRVTAALAKLLEPNRARRRSFRKELANVYDVRSRIVHGSRIDAAKVREARNVAVDVAVRALKEFYRRGNEWMSMKSTERSDCLLLD